MNERLGELESRVDHLENEVRRLSSLAATSRLGDDTEPSGELDARFDALADEWLDATSIHSTGIIFLHPAYKRILEMGLEAVPLVLRRIAAHPGPLMQALSDILGESPVKPQNRGNVNAMARDWVEWADRRGIQWRTKTSGN